MQTIVALEQGGQVGRRECCRELSPSARRDPEWLLLSASLRENPEYGKRWEPLMAPLTADRRETPAKPDFGLGSPGLCHDEVQPGKLYI